MRFAFSLCVAVEGGAFPTPHCSPSRLII